MKPRSWTSRSSFRDSSAFEYLTASSFQNGSRCLFVKDPHHPRQKTIAPTRPRRLGMPPSPAIGVERIKIGIALNQRPHLLLRKNKRLIDLRQSVLFSSVSIRAALQTPQMKSAIDINHFTGRERKTPSRNRRDRASDIFRSAPAPDRSQPSAISSSYFSLTFAVMSVAITPGRIS